MVLRDRAKPTTGSSVLCPWISSSCDEEELELLNLDS